MNINGRRFRATIVGVVAAAFVLAGCSSNVSAGGSQQTAVPNPGKASGTLNILEQGQSSGTPTTDPVTAAFEKKYPNVKVKITYDPSTDWKTFFSNTQTRLASGKHYDLIYLPTEGQRLFASKGLVVPLNSWISRDKTAMDVFYASANKTIVNDAKSLASTDGSTYFIPAIFNTMGMYLNKATFEKAGVAVPSADWTWSDFMNTCKELKAAGVQFCYNSDNGFFTGIEPWLTTNGANVLNADWSQATADTASAIAAVSFARSLVADGLAPTPSTTTGSNFDVAALVAQGKIAMTGGGSWITDSLKAAKLPLSNMEILPWPKGSQSGSPVGWGSYGLMKSSQNKELGWDYIKFELSPQAQDMIGTTAMASYGAAPVVKSSFDKGLGGTFYPEGYQYLYQALDYATPVPGPAAAVQVESDTGSAYSSILAGNTSPSDGMKQLNTKLTADIAAH